MLRPPYATSSKILGVANREEAAPARIAPSVSFSPPANRCSPTSEKKTPPPASRRRWSRRWRTGRSARYRPGGWGHQRWGTGGLARIMEARYEDGARNEVHRIGEGRNPS